MSDEQVSRHRRVYQGARSLDDAYGLFEAHAKDAELSVGSDRVAVLLDTEPIAVIGLAQTVPTARRRS